MDARKIRKIRDHFRELSLPYDPDGFLDAIARKIAGRDIFRTYVTATATAIRDATT